MGEGKLVERLRDYRGGDTEFRQLMDAAADRIEQLERALGRALDMLEHPGIADSKSDV